MLSSLSAPHTFRFGAPAIPSPSGVSGSLAVSDTNVLSVVPTPNFTDGYTVTWE